MAPDRQWWAHENYLAYLEGSGREPWRYPHSETPLSREAPAAGFLTDSPVASRPVHNVPVFFVQETRPRFSRKTYAGVLFVMACLLVTAYLLLAANGQSV